MVPPILIIGCSVQKSDYPGPAGIVYQGPLVQLGLRYAEVRGWTPYILSGRYGLITPDNIIQPYDERAPRGHRWPEAMWPQSSGYWLGSSEYFKHAPPHIRRLMPIATSYGEQKCILTRWIRGECYLHVVPASWSEKKHGGLANVR